MTILVPMREEVFASYQKASIDRYAADNVACGRWSKEVAQARSKAEFEGLLPNGLATKGHHLFEIKDGKKGLTVGFIWFLINQKEGACDVFICDVEVKEQFRRQGHAKRAFLVLEELAKEFGASAIGLHVFAHNAKAKALYTQIGFSSTGINMRKQLGGK